MKNFNKLSVAIIAATASSFVSAVELGEINGTKFSVGGYLKAEAIWGMPNSDCTLNPGNAIGCDNVVETSTRQSRFNLKATKEVDGHKLGGFIEGDFWGSAGSADAWRLRHAYISIDNLTVGQTWSGQFFATAPYSPSMINFFGPGFGTIAGTGATVRPDMVIHYRTNGFTLTAQDPIYTEASMPDLVASYGKRFKSGSAYSAAITARDVQTVAASATTSEKSEIGAALSLLGKFAVGKGALFAGGFAGKGAGVYSGMCVGGPLNPNTPDSCDVESGDLVSQKGYNLGITQNLTEKLNGTITYGKVMVDDIAESEGYMTTATLMYSYLPGLDFGIEWRDQDMQNHPMRVPGQQVEVMAMYKF